MALQKEIPTLSPNARDNVKLVLTPEVKEKIIKEFEKIGCLYISNQRQINNHTLSFQHPKLPDSMFNIYKSGYIRRVFNGSSHYPWAGTEQRMYQLNPVKTVEHSHQYYGGTYTYNRSVRLLYNTYEGAAEKLLDYLKKKLKRLEKKN